uniref:Uncharacterized protein n=1 Tax=Brassica oleracea TaxID=3712 RepID=A0A3P6DDU7_BRAOL|nr:unnamed protein product [Brassica oleracea]
MHPNMRVSDLINQESKEWDIGLLEDYVHPDDIPLIRSMAISSISSTHRRDILGCSKSIEARRRKGNTGTEHH